MLKILRFCTHVIGSYLGGRGLGLLRRPMTSAGAWNEIREMRGKGHSLSGPARTSLPHRVLLLQQTNSSIPGTTKLNSARVFYLGLCPSGLFILKKNKFSQKKNSVQGKTGIRPKSNHISTLRSYLNRGYIKFSYTGSFKRATHLAVA